MDIVPWFFIRHSIGSSPEMDEPSSLSLTLKPRRLSENGYFPQSLRQAQIIILEILQCIPVVIIFAFLDLGKNISFSDTLLDGLKRSFAGVRTC